jgi:hypothetical protein
MIADAESGLFDLIITKEISRFSRSTLDSIKYTQMLLEHGVGVYFQNDNINTIYPDAELRLTIMSSIAQDEVRRLSERIKFGMKRAYETGKVLGRDNIYGYNKIGGKLEIKEDEAKFVREVYQLYADGKYGYRTIAKILTEKGYKNQSGKEINPAILKGIITNPKYKGYYHGRLTESSDYKHKKNIKLPDDDRILYKDDNIPSIVSEELWNKANKFLNERTEKFKHKSSGTQNRFAYSAKIKCEEHGTYHYRKMWKDRKIPAEGWCCKHYITKGRVACKTPNVYTKDLDAILEYIGNDLLKDKEKYTKSIDNLLSLYEKTEGGNINYIKEITKISKELDKIISKKDKLLELYTDGDLEKSEYLKSNTRLAESADKLKSEIDRLQTEEKNGIDRNAVLKQARLFFENISKTELNPLEIAQEMLDEITVCKGSTKNHIKLKISMKYGELLSAVIANIDILHSDTEVSPIVGTEKQSEELVRFLLHEFEEDPRKIWQSNMFGKSLHELVNEGLHTKLAHMPLDARERLSETLERIINEGSGGLICIIL